MWSRSNPHSCQAFTPAVPLPAPFPALATEVSGAPDAHALDLSRELGESWRAPLVLGAPWLCQTSPSNRPPPSHAAPYRLAVDITQHRGGVDLVEAGERVQQVGAAGGVAHAIGRELHHCLARLHHPQLSAQTNGSLHYTGVQGGPGHREPSTHPTHGSLIPALPPRSPHSYLAQPHTFSSLCMNSSSSWDFSHWMGQRQSAPWVGRPSPALGSSLPPEPLSLSLQRWRRDWRA